LSRLRIIESRFAFAVILRLGTRFFGFGMAKALPSPLGFPAILYS
jgi:hypothetical protein